MEEQRDLRTERLYEAFASYPLKPRLDACPHCISEDAEASLHALSLRHMDWWDFGIYPFKAITTFGDLDDFKHFLPRLFELYLLRPEQARYDVSIFLSKLTYAKWHEWPTSEVVAIRAFVAYWLQSAAASARFSERDPSALDDLRAALEEAGIHAQT